MKNLIQFSVLALFITFFYSCSNSSWKSAVFQGILRSADGPGREITLYLMPDQKFIEKTLYLKTPEKPEFNYGAWSIIKNRVILVYITGSTNFFQIDGKSLVSVTEVMTEDMQYGFRLYLTGSYR